MQRLTWTLTLCVVALSGCAVTTAGPEVATRSRLSTHEMLKEGAQLMARGDTAGARERLAYAAALDVTNPTRQTLLGLSYHAETDGGPERLRMARVGYEAALKAAPADHWARWLAGRAAFELGDHQGAIAHFAKLTLNEPLSVSPFAALAVAAYQGGDLPLALMAAERAERLANRDRGAPADALALRTAVQVRLLAHAAQGDEAAVREALGQLTPLDARAADRLRPRLAQLIRTASIDEAPTTLPHPEVAPVAEAQQISVDVVILLAQHKRSDRVGINLLDGLKLQFGARDERREVRNVDGRNIERTITQAISLPELTYNLNIFNRLGASYEVAARPMLTAHLGEESEFFVGRSLRVAVKGLNDSSLETVDVGIELKALPVEIDEQGAKLKITAERSFLQEEPVGTFAEGLSTFRQFVTATARVQFGETLVLSGLSETVTDSNGSKTPFIGDLPLVGRAFNQRTTDQRRDAVLILVTPSRPTQWSSQPWARSESVQRLITMWGKVIDPATNAAQVSARLASTRLFTRMQRDDVTLTWPPALGDLGALGQSILNLDAAD